MKKRTLKVIALSVSLVTCAVLYNDCSNTVFNSIKNNGTATVGNPMAPASWELLISICGVINRCNNQVSYSQCLDGVLNAPVNTQVGAPATYTTFSSVEQGEQSGGLTVNQSSLNSCSANINTLSCSSSQVQNAYNPNASNPFDGVANMIPTQSCNTVFTQQVISSWAFADGGQSTGINVSASQNGQTPQLAVFNNQVYGTWSESNGSNDEVRVKVYNGASWSSVDGGGSAGINFNSAADGTTPSLGVFNNQLYATWEEIYQGKAQTRVAVYNGNSSWSIVDGGNGGIGMFTGEGYNPQLVVYNNQLYDAWIEEDANEVYQLHVKVYNGNSSWTSVDGGSVAPDSGAPQMAVYNGLLYIAFGQYYTGGTGLVHVMSYNGSSWSWADGDNGINFNTDTAHWAQMPQLAVFNGQLYTTWQEWGTTVRQIRVAVYNGGSSWTFVDGDTINGLNDNSAEDATLPQFTVVGDQLFVTWQEPNSSNISQIRVKTYSGGSSWSFVDGGGATGLNFNSSQNAQNPAAVAFGNQLFTTWQETFNGITQIRVDAGSP